MLIGILAAMLPIGQKENMYSDYASGKLDDRPDLQACLKALRTGDTLVVWKLDRLGRNLQHLISIVDELQNRNIGFKVLTVSAKIKGTRKLH